MTSIDIKSSLDLITRSAENISSNKEVISVTNAFRYLRNLCGKDSDFQNQIFLESNSVISTKKILFSFLTAENIDQEQLLCFQVGLQFLGNLIVNNKNNQRQLWLSCQDLLEGCLKFKDAKVQNFSTMILYNIFLGNPDLLNELKHSFEDICEHTMRESNSEFSVFILELFVLKSDIVLKFYDELKSENRLIILEIIKNLVTEQNNETIKPETIRFIAKQFTSKSDLILKTCESYANSLDPVEIVKMLDLLVAFSSDDKQCYLDIVQKETSLLINCIELLKNIHFISKQSGNNFSMITKISEISKVEEANSIQEHPMFGFKGSLIRLMGNFCWKNRDNQDQVRKLDCMPVLLDCCNIDARNPFIMQWCILAIRNICNKNPENQLVIAAMSEKGEIDSARLQELGITLNVNNGEILSIAPLK